MNHPPSRKPLDISSQIFWDRVWEETGKRSVLKTSQDLHPDRWAAFYDRVADLWLDIGGGEDIPAKEVVQEFFHQGILEPGHRVLDVGCGPGTFALPLTEHGLKVTAIDSSPGMIALFRQRAAAREGLTNLKIQQTAWEVYQPGQRFDLVLAACFPQACQPSGLLRLETWSRGHCALVIGSGAEAFPFRRLLWTRVMKTPLLDSKAPFYCLINSLMTRGRNPNMLHLSRPVHLVLPLEKVFLFYKHYFSIFGKRGVKIESLLREGLTPFVHRNQIRAAGQMSLILIWWRTGKNHSPCRKGKGG